MYTEVNPADAYGEDGEHKNYAEKTFQRDWNFRHNRQVNKKSVECHGAHGVTTWKT